MSLRSRSLQIALSVFLFVVSAQAQPHPSGQSTPLERLARSYEQYRTGSIVRSAASFETLIDPQFLRAWDPQTQLTRIEMLGHLRPLRNVDPLLEDLIGKYSSSPYAPYLLVRRGLSALQRGEHGQARLYLNEAVAAAAERDVDNIDENAAGTAHYWLGIAHLTDRDATMQAQAAVALQASCNDYPRNPFADDACFALGQMYESYGELDTAIAYYSQLVERYSTSELRLEAALRAAQSHLRLTRIEEARALLASVSSELAETPADVERHALQTAEYHLLKAAAEEYAGDYVAAERSYLAVVYSLDSPYRRAAMLGLADTYRAAGHMDSATAIFTRIVAQDRRDDAGMYADYQLAIAELEPPYQPETLRPLQVIAYDTAHRMTSQARLILAGIHYLRQEFALTANLLDSSLAPVNRPALRSKALLLRGVNKLALMRYREADDDLVQSLRIARSTPLALLPERDTVVAHAALAGAIAMIHASRPSDAVPQLNRLLQTQLNDAIAAEATYWLGEAYYAAGVLPASVQTMEDLIERFPMSKRIEDALYAIGWGQLHQRKLERAEAAFSRLVKAYPLTVYATEAHLRRGDCLYLMRKYADAAQAFQLADSAGAHPDLVEYARYQASLALYHHEKRDDARRGFARFTETYTQSELADDALFMVGLIDYIERRYADAVMNFNALSRSFSSSVLIARARTMTSASYYALGHFDSASAAAQAVIDKHQESSYVAEAQAALDRAESALRAEEKKAALEDKKIEEMLDRARGHRSNGRYADAISLFASARDRARTNETLALTLLEIATTHMLADDTSRALESMHAATQLSSTPSGRRAIWRLADHYRDRNVTDSAIVYYQRIADSDSSHGLAYLRIGQTYLRDEQWSAALKAFTRAIDSAKGGAAIVAEAHLGIAAAHAAKGDVVRAREIFERLIRERTTEEITRRAEEQLRALGNL